MASIYNRRNREALTALLALLLLVGLVFALPVLLGSQDRVDRVTNFLGMGALWLVLWRSAERIAASVARRFYPTDEDTTGTIG